MAKKFKFKNEAEYQKAVHKIEWEARVSPHLDETRRRIQEARQAHNTSSLDDAEFLLKLFEEKILEHNGRCKQQAGIMKTSYYKRDNIES